MIVLRETAKCLLRANLGKEYEDFLSDKEKIKDEYIDYLTDELKIILDTPEGEIKKKTKEFYTAAEEIFKKMGKECSELMKGKKEHVMEFLDLVLDLDYGESVFGKIF